MLLVNLQKKYLSGLGGSSRVVIGICFAHYSKFQFLKKGSVLQVMNCYPLLVAAFARL